LSRSVKPEARRRYDASRRQAAAGRTRRAILAAAGALFLERGYARTTMAAIANAAGVSVETLYLSVGPKAGILRYMLETALSGTDEPVPGPQRDWVREFVAEPDPRLKIRLHAAPAVRDLHRRLSPLWAVVVEAAPGDAQLRSLIEELDHRRVEHMRLMAQHLADEAGLREGLSVDTAADILWATNSPEFYGLLARRGWDATTIERWLADTWTRLLLGDQAGDSAGTDA
jgi:AcrR family transcriptional regulator